MDAVAILAIVILAVAVCVLMEIGHRRNEAALNKAWGTAWARMNDERTAYHHNMKVLLQTAMNLVQGEEQHLSVIQGNLRQMFQQMEVNATQVVGEATREAVAHATTQIRAEMTKKLEASEKAKDGGPVGR
jgi:hypothetical protein